MVAKKKQSKRGRTGHSGFDAYLEKKDPVLLSDTDRKKVAQHFRSKVHDAKRKSELSGTSSFIEDIMKVLDYRDWYQFIIYYTKTGEPRREMKKSNFNTFSGGERAMAMYTPLLAAVDARLQNARPNAPRIFALDEAFAGVDEKNIREAFKVIESYDFDYTLNSQAIWATFEEVPDLSIVVLSRLGNANVVMSTATHGMVFGNCPSMNLKKSRKTTANHSNRKSPYFN